MLFRSWLNLMAPPPGERGQTWPAHLLPLTWTDPGHDCVDMQKGTMIYWDEESLADGPSDKVWKRSFKPDAPDLATWFDRWLGTQSPEKRMQELMQAALARPQPKPVMSDTMLAGIKQTIAYWRARTPKERADFGMPEVGWENFLFGHLGVDASKL